MDADAAANAAGLIADYLEIDKLEGTDASAGTVVYTLAAGYTALGVILGLRHADDAEICHADLGAVIGTAGKGDLHMPVRGEDILLHLSGQICCVVAAEGAESGSRAGLDITGSGRRIAGTLLFLVDIQGVNDRLDFLIYLVNVFHRDAGDLNTLAVCDIYHAFSVLLRDLNYLAKRSRVDDAARDTDTGSRLAAHLGIAEGVLLYLVDIDVLIPDVRI